MCCAVSNTRRRSLRHLHPFSPNNAGIIGAITGRMCTVMISYLSSCIVCCRRLCPHQSRAMPCTSASPFCIAVLISAAHNSYGSGCFRPPRTPYSELHIGTPHMESNHLLQFATVRELHSLLRFSGGQTISNLRPASAAPLTYIPQVMYLRRRYILAPYPRSTMREVAVSLRVVQTLT